MHDPMTVAFNIRIPLCYKRANSLYKDNRKEWQFYDLATIWHVDPEKDGADDSCGWFMRSRHGDQKVLAKIEKRFAEDWDRTFQSDGTGHIYACGLFKPDGNPNLSVQGIVLNLFFLAAIEHFNSDGRTNWRKAKRWMTANLFDIMLFAENPCDSLFDGITRKFEIGCNEVQTPRRREERIKSMASCIYSWILRKERPWYRHPRWHVWHWKIQVPLFQYIHRWLFAKCCKCGGHFGWKESPISDWNGTRIWHQSCDSARVAETPKQADRHEAKPK